MPTWTAAFRAVATWASNGRYTLLLEDGGELIAESGEVLEIEHDAPVWTADVRARPTWN